MRKRSIRTLTVLAAAAGIAAVASAAPAAAIAVGPRQYFVGTVNNHTATAVIDVLCAGPANTGHPVGNQVIGINLLLPPTTGTVGYTGLDATSIDASLSWTSAGLAEHLATFTAYGTAPIPTGINVPCGGTGLVTFAPTPDDGGRPSTVQVTFVNLGV